MCSKKVIGTAFWKKTLISSLPLGTSACLLMTASPVLKDSLELLVSSSLAALLTARKTQTAREKVKTILWRTGTSCVRSIYSVRSLKEMLLKRLTTNVQMSPQWAKSVLWVNSTKFLGRSSERSDVNMGMSACTKRKTKTSLEATNASSGSLSREELRWSPLFSLPVMEKELLSLELKDMINWREHAFTTISFRIDQAANLNSIACRDLNARMVLLRDRI